jgi:rubrerythrin
MAEKEVNLAKLLRGVASSAATISDVIELEKRSKLEELELLKLERLLEEERARLAKLRGTLQQMGVQGGVSGLDTSQPQVTGAGAAAVLGLMLANPKFAEAVKNMSDEDLLRLLAVASALSSPAGAQTAMLPVLLALAVSRGSNQQGGQGQQRSPIEDAVNLTKALVETIRLLQPPQPQQPPPQMTASDIAALFKTVFDAVVALRQSQQPPQHQPQGQSPISLVKEVAEAIKTLSEVTAPAKEIHERLEKLERQIMRPDEWIKFIREQAELLGLRPSSVDKELEKLRIELEKWRTEKELELAKWRAEQEADERKLQAVAQLLQGPIGSTIEKLAASALQGSRSTPPRQELIRCGVCGHVFEVPAGATEAVCPKCGTLLAKRPRIREVAQGGRSGTEEGGGSAQRGAEGPRVAETTAVGGGGAGGSAAGATAAAGGGAAQGLIEPPPPVVVGAEGGGGGG